jgi:hypothetical protein
MPRSDVGRIDAEHFGIYSLPKVQFELLTVHHAISSSFQSCSSHTMPQSSSDGNSAVRPNDVWEEHARQLIRDLMHASRIRGWKELSKRLSEIGINIDSKVLANKVNRGRFQATLVLQVMAALKATEVRALWDEFPPCAKESSQKGRDPE